MARLSSIVLIVVLATALRIMPHGDAQGQNAKAEGAVVIGGVAQVVALTSFRQRQAAKDVALKQ